MAVDTSSAVDDEFDLVFDDIGCLSEQTPTRNGTSHGDTVAVQTRNKYMISEDQLLQDVQTDSGGGTLERMLAYQAVTTTTNNSECSTQEISVSASKYEVTNKTQVSSEQEFHLPEPKTQAPEIEQQQQQQSFFVETNNRQVSENSSTQQDQSVETTGSKMVAIAATSMLPVPNAETTHAEEKEQGAQKVEPVENGVQAVEPQHHQPQQMELFQPHQHQESESATALLRVNGMLGSLTMAEENEDKAQETKPSAELLQAQEEWDALETVEPGQEVHTMPLISFNEVLGYFQGVDMSLYLKKIKPTQHRTGFAAFKHLLFGPPKMNKSLHEERNLVFAIAQCPLDNGETIHTRTLQTIYKKLTGSKFDCPRYGNHWEQIGFQGNDPATDLRATGFLGLMTLLYFVMDPNTLTLAREIYKLSTHEVQNFPFCVMSINMTRIVIQSLREEILSKECNRRQQVFGVINDYYVGIYLHLYQIWKKQHKTIKDSGYVLKDVETFAKKNPRTVIRNLETYLSERSKQQPSKKAPSEDPMDFAGVHELD